MNSIPWRHILECLKGNGKSESLESWIRENVRHLELWNELQRVWLETQETAGEFYPDTDVAWMQIQKKITSPNKTRKVNLRTIFINRRFVAASVIVLMVCSSALFWYKLRNAGPDGSDVSQPTVYAQHEGFNGKSRIILPDQSLVWLNSGSVLKYGNNFSQKDREVHLNGEGFFEITHLEDNIPFIVHLNGIDVKVYGTRFNVNSFNVNAFEKDSKIGVTLLEGSVSLLCNGKEEFLSPGYQGIYDRDSKEISIQQVDTSLATLWKKDELTIENRTLKEIFEHLEYWYRTSVNITSDIASSTSTYSLIIKDQSLDNVLRSLQKARHFNYSKRNGEFFIY